MTAAAGAATEATVVPPVVPSAEIPRQLARLLSFPERRTLPLAVPIRPGESLDSWVEAVADRFDISTTTARDALGLRRGTVYTSTMLRMSPTALHRAAGLAGLPKTALVEAAGVELPAAVWLRGCRSRYCPACLATTGGRWQLSWRGAPIAVCRDHSLLLQDRCPACGAFPRIAMRAAPSPMHCIARVGAGSSCGADLSLAPRVPAPDDAAGEHVWAAEILAAAASHAPSAAALRDLPMVLTWVERVTDPAGTARAADGRYRSASTTLALLPATARVLGIDDASAVDAIRNMVRQGRPPLTPTGVSSTSFLDSGGPFRARYLRAVDDTLTAADRLRHRTTTTTSSPAGSPSTRLCFIPELLWPDWYARLLPTAGLNGDCARTAFTAALLLPGQRQQGAQLAIDQLAPHRGRSAISAVLRRHSPRVRTDVLTLLTPLADHLDTIGVPIDYGRRRELLTRQDLLPWAVWRSIALDAGTHPGDENPGSVRTSTRALHAHRYLQVLLVGADLSNPAHPLSWRTPGDRSRYHQFADSMPPKLREGLRRQAEKVLAHVGVDEPVVWTPPSHLADGLVLPGLDPSALDRHVVQAVVGGEISPAVAAHQLGVHVEHLRMAIPALDLPVPAQLNDAALARLRTPEKVTRIATKEFFEQHYVADGKTLRELSILTGLPRRLLAARAAELRIPIRSPNDPRPIDPGWLREQYVDLGQSILEIAEKLHSTEATVTRALRRHSIPARAPGVHARREMHAPVSHDHAPIVRAAVRATLHGWLRLSRFQVAMGYPSMKTAALQHDWHPVALTREVQRLEGDIGDLLYVRATFGRPQRSTTRGQELLDALNHPATAAAMRSAVGPPPSPPSAAQKRRHLAEHSTRRPARAPAAYPGIAVKTLRRTGPLLAIVQYLLDHDGEEVWGYPLSAATGYGLGTIYPLLDRLHHHGWTLARIETPSECAARAPHARGEGRRRHFHRLTTEGVLAANYITRFGVVNSPDRPVDQEGSSHQRLRPHDFPAPLSVSASTLTATNPPGHHPEIGSSHQGVGSCD